MRPDIISKGFDYQRWKKVYSKMKQVKFTKLVTAKGRNVQCVQNTSFIHSFFQLGACTHITCKTIVS